jgi:hypothetical protein
MQRYTLVQGGGEHSHWCLPLQHDLRKLLESVNRTRLHDNAAANNQAVITVLRWSYDQLPIDHRCSASAAQSDSFLPAVT